jgi:hypothetical protein
MYFIIGYDGEILTKGKFTSSTGGKRKSVGSDGVSNKIHDDNYQGIALEAIEAVLAAYFFAKSSSFTTSSLKVLKKLILQCQNKLVRVHALQQKVLIDMEKPKKGPVVAPPNRINNKHLKSKSRKQHFLLHCVDQNMIEEYGPPSQFDTNSFETAHQTNTTHIWNASSKRYYIYYVLCGYLKF